MNKILSKIIFIITLAVLLFPSCESVNDSLESGTLLVKVTDAPFPTDFVESATITITKIEVRQKGETEEGPYIVISEEPMDFNLMELRNGITASLPEIDIPAGSYDLVRLYIENAKIVLIDGLGEFNLKVPSGNQTGIKIFIKPEIQIQGNLTAELLLDFDLSNSFVALGNTNKPDGISGFNFKPVVRAVNNSLAGSILGTVTDENGPLEGVLITVSLEGESATALTNDNGYYEILGLKEGLYSVSATIAGYISNETAGILVKANEKTQQNFNLLNL